MKRGCPYGSHRVIEPVGGLPQAAWKIDNTPQIYSNEILIDVTRLNIDAASFAQIKRETHEKTEQTSQMILDLVRKRGKHHNPVTDSGGMLIGTVIEIGEDLAGKVDLKCGDRIATLVSLTLTPLVIEKINQIRFAVDQVDITGKAILFESGVYAKLPPEIPDGIALALLDVAGALPQTARLVQLGDTVFIIGGGGKSGLLCLYEARRRAGPTGKVIALARGDSSYKRALETGWADVVIQGDATKPLAVLEAIKKVTDGALADVTINCVNIPGTEMATILSTKERGVIYFFSMATSFTAAALGAEGVGKDVTMLIGNGYTRDHAQISFHALAESTQLRQLFDQLYS
ncbi:L-erythro-3,5-diaminohexanoate dehydrogenase [Candidatus Acetothermia bacterium]|jgi:L-erythro-3,5-diaminohexanoate dehydrogenase|nr:L-erythro-3,5-diaminohexanoate dehydrogenase [Candidatus Acetothermia bacterium]MCI2427231.1 L-erythro-3,5-diaminohexanoate dehydrogenase [Candidatus Acetothermia bacterium]MCI2428744.1 L-erythro-3,5-diaminohexanoate dehydrogenase [Candidatus Acetothermia bacterium]